MSGLAAAPPSIAETVAVQYRFRIPTGALVLRLPTADPITLWLFRRGNGETSWTVLFGTPNGT
jgi:hypothetical protein